jgi:hypothetical protein
MWQDTVTADQGEAVTPIGAVRGPRPVESPYGERRSGGHMNEWQIQLEEDLNGSADQDLGTVVAVCDGMGRYDDGSLLELCELRYHVADDNWTPQIVTADLMQTRCY